MRLCSVYGFAGNKTILILTNSCRLFALENLSFLMAMHRLSPRDMITYVVVLTILINFLAVLTSKKLYSRERH